MAKTQILVSFMELLRQMGHHLVRGHLFGDKHSGCSGDLVAYLTDQSTDYSLLTSLHFRYVIPE